MNRLILAIVFAVLATSEVRAFEIAATSSGTVREINGDGDAIFDSVLSGNLTIRSFQGYFSSDFEDVGIAEFAAPATPEGMRIESASVSFVSIATSSNAGRIVNIFGFQSDGLITLADATATGLLLGSYDNFALGLGAHTIALDVPAFSTIVDGSDFLALRFQGSVLTVNTQLNMPVLNVEYAPVPIPPAILLFGTGVSLLLGFKNGAGRSPG